jgi:hypothetical protein
VLVRLGASGGAPRVRVAARLPRFGIHPGAMLALVALCSSARFESKSQQSLLAREEKSEASTYASAVNEVLERHSMHAAFREDLEARRADAAALAAEGVDTKDPCPSLACSLGLWPSLLTEADAAATDEKEEALTRNNAKKKSERCKGLVSWATNLWCNQACKPAPFEKYCKGVCKCPNPNDPVKNEPPPPEPRIIGGWTDCGGDSGITKESLMRAWVHHKPRGNRTRLDVPRPSTPNCTRDEESIVGALPSKSPDDEWIGMGMGRGIKREPSFHHTWGATAILPGRFGGSEIAPYVGKPSNYKYFWLTFGGQGTKSKDWALTAEQDIINAKAKGAAFDMEGGVQRDAVMKWIAEMRPKHPDWTYVHVPQAHDSPIPYKAENEGLPDFVAPMLYYSNFDSYPDMDISKGDEGVSEAKYSLLRLKKAGWPASRTILTFQSFDAARMRTDGDHELMPFLGKLLGDFSMETKVYGEPLRLQGPYAGVLGWPAQCGEGDFRCWPEADRSNVKQLLKGAKAAGVKIQGHLVQD